MATIGPKRNPGRHRALAGLPVVLRITSRTESFEDGVNRGRPAHVARHHASFTTCHNDVPHTCGVVVDCRDSDDGFSDFDFGALAVAAHRPDAAAYGKVAIVRQDGIAVFQADRERGIAPAFCGNATAAAMRFVNADGDSRNAVLGAAGVDYEVSARINGRTVSQTWVVPQAKIEERTWRGRPTLVVEMLNQYALVVGPLPEGVSAEAARYEILGASLTAKLAVVASADSTPVVEFYNANGRHGAVPQTGVASIALAARAVPWFADLFGDMRLAYRTRTGSAVVELPAVESVCNGRVAITMPTVAVDLCELHG